MNLWKQQLSHLASVGYQNKPAVNVPAKETVTAKPVPVKKEIPVKQVQPKGVAKRGKTNTNKR